MGYYSKSAIASFLGLISAILIVGGALLFTEKVEDGYVTVVSTTTGGASEILDAGWHLVGIFDKTTDYPIRTQLTEGSVAVATSDNKRIDLPYNYEYNVNKDLVLDIFKKFGRQDVETIQSSFIQSRLNKTIKEVVGRYSVLDIRGAESGVASEEILVKITEELKSLGFIVTNVSLGIPEVDASTQDMIDKNTKAVQEQELKKTEKTNAELDAETALIRSQSEAEQAIIKAEGEAKANNVLQQSISEELLKKEYIEKWDGKEPLVKGDGGAIINLPETPVEEVE